jgi:hypothetical protein
MKNKTCRNVMDTIDIYGGTPNQFTIKGRSNLHSYSGVGCSILHFIAIFIFACLKLSFVITKFNPQVSVFDEAE